MEIVAACHCGMVIMRLAAKPAEIYECSCSICRRLGVLWAYYPCNDVVFEKGADATNIYVWNTRILEFHRCSVCGCTTHWVATDRTYRDRMGVNARLIEGLNHANTALMHIDRGETGLFWTRERGA